MKEHVDPIADDELVYRRIPSQPEYFNPEIASHTTPLSFRPLKNDTTDVSVYRAKYKTMQQVAINPRGKRYFIAVLRAGNLRASGINVIPRPLPHDLGHAEIPDLTYENKRTECAKELQIMLAHELCFCVEGPFP